MDSHRAAGRRRLAGAPWRRGELLGYVTGGTAARRPARIEAAPAGGQLALGKHGTRVDHLVPGSAMADGRASLPRDKVPGMAMGDGQRGLGEPHVNGDPRPRAREPAASSAGPGIAHRGGPAVPDQSYVQGRGLEPRFGASVGIRIRCLSGNNRDGAGRPAGLPRTRDEPVSGSGSSVPQSVPFGRRFELAAAGIDGPWPPPGGYAAPDRITYRTVPEVATCVLADRAVQGQSAFWI